MKPLKLKRIATRLREHSRVLRGRSWHTYLDLLTRVSRSFPNFAFCRDLERLIISKDYDGMLSLGDSLSEQKYSDAAMHFAANQVASLIRKYPYPKGTVNTDPEGRAVELFFRNERKCSRRNRFFDLLKKRNPYEQEFSRARSWIQYVIGPAPNIEGILERTGFGNGANVGVHGNATHVGRKISSHEWTCTPGAYTLGFNAVISHTQLRYQLFEKRGGYYCLDGTYAFQKYRERTKIIAYNKIAFVPKTAKIHRTIAVEPLVNGFLQKGADLYLRSCLRRVNIDLRDQTRNQQMARKGSMLDSEDSFVTIDLSSASDCISIGLVRDLLPPDWFYLLDSIRSKEYMVDGKVSKYHKFCSMGNGFCFPLETLIFCAVCFACGCGTPGQDFSVYGDDIIVRKKYSGQVIKLLTKFGFSVNKSKTFLSGSFRESCGADWFGGEAVRPITLDYALDSVESIFKFLNLSRSNPRSKDFFFDIREFIISLLPSDLRLFRPYQGNVDAGIDAEADEYLSCPYCRFDKNLQSWTWLELRHSSVDDMSPISAGIDDESIWFYALLSGAMSSHSLRHPVRLALRRKTRTTITRTGYSGATSLWLPLN